MSHFHEAQREFVNSEHNGNTILEMHQLTKTVQ